MAEIPKPDYKIQSICFFQKTKLHIRCSTVSNSDLNLRTCTQSALTVCGSVGFKQAEAVMGTLGTIGKAF